VSPETGFALFDHDGVFHKVILFQTGLFENVVKCPRRNVDVWFAGDGNGSAFRLMFELTVATLRSGKIPTIVFEQPDQVPHFHARIMEASSVN
jgi:hypothetical protein